MCKFRYESQNVSSGTTGVGDSVVNILRGCGCSLTAPVLAPPLTCSHRESLKRPVTPESRSSENPNSQILISAINKAGNLGKTLLYLCVSVLCWSHRGSVSLLCSVQISSSTISPVLGKGLSSMLYRDIFKRIPGTAIARHRKIIITSPGTLSLSCLLFDSLKKK